jgi:HPt (histidine-containing phosphotransfer) domain-containing protein
MPNLLLNLRCALENEDVDLFRRTAHTIKSTARDYGAVQLAQLSQQLEIMGKERKLTGAQDLVTQVETGYEPVRAALKKFLEGIPDGK